MRVGAYRVTRELGRGTFFRVVEATDPDSGEAVAVKVPLQPVADRVSTMEHVENERFALGRLRGVRGAVRLRCVRYGALVTEKGRDPYKCPVLVTELAPRGDLFDAIRNGGAMPERVVRRIARRLVGTLAAAHARGVAHRDIKPEQVLLGAGGDAVLCDWGFSSAASGRPGDALPSYDRVGSDMYAAPELCLVACTSGTGPPPASRAYDPFATDVWSLGTLLHTALVGFPPFQDPSAADTRFAAWCRGCDTFWAHARAQGVMPSPGAVALLRRMMCERPEGRPTMAEVAADPWLRADREADDDGAYLAEIVRRCPLPAGEDAENRAGNSGCAPEAGAA